MTALQEGGAPPSTASLPPPTVTMPSVGNHSTPMNYRDSLIRALSNSSPTTIPADNLNFANLPRPIQITHKGEIGLIFPSKLIDAYAQPFRYSLVRKFSTGKPALELVRNFFKSLDLSLEFTVGLLDHRHVIIKLSGEDDYHRISSRNIWYINNYPMTVFPWTPSFHVDREASTHLIWFGFEKLPMQYLNGDALFTIGNMFGKSLRIDSATALAKRPNYARLQVEIDLTIPVPSRVWLEMETKGDGFWQEFGPEVPIPAYCLYCSRKGHSENNCHNKHPELKEKSIPTTTTYTHIVPRVSKEKGKKKLGQSL